MSGEEVKNIKFKLFVLVPTDEDAKEVQEICDSNSRIS